MASRKFKTISGIFDTEGHVVQYKSTDFFIRTNGVDVKVRSKEFGREVAKLANESAGKVISWLVTKYTTFEIIGGNKKRNEMIYEIEDDKFIYEMHLKYK